MVLKGQKLTIANCHYIFGPRPTSPKLRVLICQRQNWHAAYSSSQAVSHISMLSACHALLDTLPARRQPSCSMKLHYTGSCDATLHNAYHQAYDAHNNRSDRKCEKAWQSCGSNCELACSFSSMCCLIQSFIARVKTAPGKTPPDLFCSDKSPCVHLPGRKSSSSSSHSTPSY